MPGSVGSIYAEASLNIDKFKAAAAQMGGEGAKIATAMEKAGASLEKTQQKLDGLNDGLNIAKSQLASASSAFQLSAAALEEMQLEAEAAAIKAAELGNAYEKAAASFGETSLQAKTASDEYEAAAAVADQLGAAVEKQQEKVDKNSIAFQKAQKAVKDYERKIDSAKDEVSDLTSKLAGLNEELSGDLGKQAADSFTDTGISAEALGDILENVKEKGLKGLGSGISYAIGQMDLFKNASGAAGAAMRMVQNSASGVARGLSASAAGWLVAAAAAGYGAYQLYQYASGAKAAKEALEEMTATAEKWKESQAETVYDTGNDPYASLGISEGDFAKTGKSAENWTESLVKTWTDGKGETDAIVSEYVDSFTEGSDKIREAIEQRKTALEGLGIEDTGAEEGLAQLDAYDKEIEALLKKRQNGFLTDDEISRLNEISAAKVELEVEYGLKETSGFEKILAGVEADNARLQALGEGPSVDTYADAMKAAALGLNDYRDALSSTYTEQYQLIQGMEDGEEKTRAMEQLNQQYAADMAAGLQEYASTLSQLYGTVWNSADVQNGEQGLKNIADLITQFNAGALSENNLATQLNEQLGQLDEGALVSYMAVASQIVDLFNQGMGTEELQNLFPEIDIAQMLGGYSTIADFLSAHTGQFEGLEGIFGMGGAVPEELQRVMATLELDTEELDTFLETPKTVKITFDASDATIEQPDPVNVLIAAYENAQDAGMPPNPSVDAVISGYKKEGSVTVVDWQAAADAVIGYYNANPDAGVDTTPIDALTAYIGYYDASKATLPTIEPIVVDVVYKRVEESSAALASGGVEFMGVPIIDSTIDKVNTLTTAMQNLGTANETLSTDQIFNELSALDANGGLGQITAFLNDVNAAVQAGEELGPEMQAQLESVLNFIAAADVSGLGTDLMAGIAVDMQAYGWATSASTVASDIENALRTACQTHSPSEMTKPIGTDLTAGVAEGMKDTASITAAAATVSQAVLDSFKSSMAGASSIGLNFSQGLASGILAGRSGVISAAASVARAAAAAAKAELDINSPSGVTFDYGEFFDLGFIKGVENMQPDIERAVRDAVHLEPPSGTLYAGERAPAPMRQSSLSIDYDRLAEAMSNVQMRMYMNERKVAEAMIVSNSRAQNNRNKSVALGYYGSAGRR